MLGITRDSWVGGSSRTKAEEAIASTHVQGVPGSLLRARGSVIEQVGVGGYEGPGPSCL